MPSHAMNKYFSFLATDATSSSPGGYALPSKAGGPEITIDPRNILRVLGKDNSTNIEEMIVALDLSISECRHDKTMAIPLLINLVKKIDSIQDVNVVNQLHALTDRYLYERHGESKTAFFLYLNFPGMVAHKNYDLDSYLRLFHDFEWSREKDSGHDKSDTRSICANASEDNYQEDSLKPTDENDSGFKP